MAERKPRPREIVAARVTRLVAGLAPVDHGEGVLPLNPGFFAMERVRMQARPKVIDVKRPVLRGSR